MKNNVVPLLSVCDFKGGSQPPKSEWIKEQKDGYVRMLQIRDFTQGNNEIEYVKIKEKMNFCTEEDILIARYGASIGKIVSGLSGTYNVALIKAIPDESKLLKKYLYYFLKSKTFQHFVHNVGSRAAQAGFNKEDLKSVNIYLPTIFEQEKITEALDLINNIISKRQSQIKALDELTQSVFLEMFGDPVVNQRKYTKSKLVDLCLKITDGTHHSPPMVEEGIPYVSAKHLGKGYLDFHSNPAYVSKEEHEKIYRRCDPIKGDVLYIKDGATTGIAGINHYDFEFSMLSSLALIRTDSEKLNNYYLVHYLNNERVKERALSNMSGGAIKRLTLKKINNFPIVVPPINSQKEFGTKIAEIEKQKKKLEEAKNHMEDLYNSLLQKAFKGELFQD